MALFDGILYRSRSEPLEQRSHAALDASWYWGGAATRAATAQTLIGWPERPLTAAMAVPTIFRCVSMLSTKVGKFRPVATRNGEPIPDDRQPGILRRPNPRTTGWDFFSATAADILLGPAFWRFHFGTRGKVQAVELLRPSDVTVSWADLARTRRTYTVANLGTFDEGEVVHLSYFQPTGSLVGMSPLAHSRALWEGQVAADALAGSNFTEGTFPAGILKSKTALSKDASKDLKDRWLASQQNTREPAVLSGEIDYEQLAVAARDAQWIEHRQWTATDLARLFGVPAPALSLPVAGGSSLTYTNVREVRTDVLIEGCDPLLCRIGSAVEQHWLPLGQGIDWDTSSYLPPQEAVEHSPGVAPPATPPQQTAPAQEQTA